MHEKYINIKRIVVPVITVIMIASQLFGCAAVSQDEALDIMQNNTQVEIEVPELSGKQDETSIQQLAWTHLSQLTTYQDTLRTPLENIFSVTYNADTGEKSGGLYGDEYSVQNQVLRGSVIDCEKLKNLDITSTNTTLQEIASLADKTYKDIADADTLTKFYVVMNSYYNLLPDEVEGQSDYNSTLTRAEFMAMLMRAETPVDEYLALDTNFTSSVGTSAYNLYAQEVAKDAYINTSDKSLNSKTYNDSITRAEAIYLVLNHYFGVEISLTDPSTSNITFKDAKNGGDIAKSQDYTNKDNAKAYELQYATNNPDTGLPTDLYKALIVASNRGLIDPTKETRWDDTLTKSEAVELIFKTFKSMTAPQSLENIPVLWNSPSATDPTVTETGEPIGQQFVNVKITPENDKNGDGYIDRLQPGDLKDGVSGEMALGITYDSVEDALADEEDGMPGGDIIIDPETGLTCVYWRKTGEIIRNGEELPGGGTYIAGEAGHEAYYAESHKELEEFFNNLSEEEKANLKFFH